MLAVKTYVGESKILVKFATSSEDWIWMIHADAFLI